jgi:hypothetical protein
MRRPVAAVGVEEVVPGRDDPRRVLPDRGHVGEVDAVGGAVESRPQRGDLVGVDHHEHRLVALEAVADERGRALQEPRPGGVEHRLVAKTCL